MNNDELIKPLVFATNNRHKVEEIRSVVGDRYRIVSLADAGIDIDIPEPFDTLEENALTKAETIYRLTGNNCFSEDTGLEVEALSGAPGVKSARYATDQNDPEANIKKLLANLSGLSNRRARFRTVIVLIIDGDLQRFEGICDGSITEKPTGISGFGYDPIFIPDGGQKCFAEMTIAEKNQYSHRKKATTKLLDYLSLHGK